jgi:hypothetical protein
VRESCIDEVRCFIFWECAGGLEDMGLLKEIGREESVMIGVDGRVG